MNSQLLMSFLLFIIFSCIALLALTLLLAHMVSG